MRLLLDTHVWLWMGLSPGRLRDGQRRVLEDAANTLYLSAASTWEMAIKYRLGKLPMPTAPAHYVPERLIRDDVYPLDVTIHHSLRVATLPAKHRDPFDRLLIAQALMEDLVLVTVDSVFAQYDVACLLE